MSSVGDMLDDLNWPPLEVRREKSSLAFFHKIHTGACIDKDISDPLCRYYYKLGHPTIHNIIGTSHTGMP